MDVSMDVARYSMEMSQAKVASQAQVSMMKNVMELEKDSMAQLLESMGVGGAFNVQA